VEIDYSKVMDKVKFWKTAIESAKDFTGTSPPALFVGRSGYPKVFVGILSPPMRIERKEAEMLDSPENWYKSQATIDQILNYRGQMIYSRFKSPIHHPSGKIVESMQELSMVKRPTDVEVELKKQPKFNMRFDSYSKPIGNPAPLQKVRLTENPSIERKVDYVTSDVDLKATNAVTKLYNYDIPVSRIQKMFTAGLLGVNFQRKFVPTRWGITAVDDIIGKNLIQRVKQHQQLGEFMLFSNTYLGNHYEILLIPAAYEYELVEAWNVDQPHPMMGADYEPYHMRKKYASKTAGAFYSGRLAVGEYLDRIKRHAAFLIVREVRPDYYAPVGIWQLRETVRGAFSRPYDRFDNIGQAVDKLCSRLTIRRKWIKKSKMMRNLKEQTRLKQFLNPKN
jgi:hypothetical protein